MKPLLCGMLLAVSLVCSAQDRPETDADPALWVVRDADTTLWIFGSVHLLPPGLSWFDEAVREAFEQADELRMEVVLPEDPTQLAPMMIELATDPERRTLTSQMTETQKSVFLAAASRMGLPVPQLEPFEPWFVSLQVAQAVALISGMSATEGVEAVLGAAAKAAGKRITAFETAEEQMRFLDSTPVSEQIEGLIGALEDPAGAVTSIRELVDSWASGDPEKTGILLQEETRSVPETRRILLTDRNARWADYVEERLKEPGSVFIAVGAGHLAGEGSVQEHLSRKGIHTQRVDY